MVFFINIYRDVCVRIFIVVLFMVVEIWKEFKCLLLVGWLNNYGLFRRWNIE